MSEIIVTTDGAIGQAMSDTDIIDLLIQPANGFAEEGPLEPDFDFLNAIEDGLLVFDSEVRFLGANRAAEQMLGQDMTVGEHGAELIERLVCEGRILTPPPLDERDYAKFLFNTVMSSNDAFKARLKDDLAVRVVGRQTQVGRYVLTLRSLENSSKDDSQPWETREQLDEVVECLEEGFALYDADFNFLMCNRRFSDLVFNDPDFRPERGQNGVEVGMIAGSRNLMKGMPEGMTLEEFARQYSAMAKSFSKGIRIEMDSGKVIEYSVHPTRSGGYLFAILDVTEREKAAREAEHQRAIAHQNEKLSALGELLAGVAHELNNPLSIVVGFSQMLEAQLVDEKQLQRVSKIRSAAERSARIVKTFLAMARQRPARIERANPAEIVEAAAEIAAYGFKADGGRLKLDFSPALSDVMVDRDQLIQVLSNLIVNAEQAMKGMGHDARMKLGISQRHGLVEFAIEDNGPGMDEATQKRIFEPFFTTKDIGEGTGFGLAFCHRIVTAHKGLLTVASAVGKGSQFTITLPAAPPLEAGEEDTGDAYTRIRMKVLVVDDERDVADLLVEMLADRGHDAQAVYAPVDAVRLAQGEHFDAVISDMKMPGMTGDAMMRLLVETRPSLSGRFGFVTGDSLSERVREFLEDGVHPFIEKPIVADELDDLIQRLSEEQGA